MYYNVNCMSTNNNSLTVHCSIGSFMYVIEKNVPTWFCLLLGFRMWKEYFWLFWYFCLSVMAALLPFFLLFTFYKVIHGICGAIHSTCISTKYKYKMIYETPASICNLHATKLGIFLRLTSVGPTQAHPIRTCTIYCLL